MRPRHVIYWSNFVTRWCPCGQ